MVDHPRCVVDGCCYVLKFWLDRIYSFRDSAISTFSRFGLNLHIHAHFGRGGVGGIFPQNDVPYRPTPKRHLLARKHVVWAIKRENRSSGTTCVQDRKKGQDRSQSHKGVFHLIEEKTPPNRFAPKSAWWLLSPA